MFAQEHGLPFPSPPVTPSVLYTFLSPSSPTVVINKAQSNTNKAAVFLKRKKKRTVLEHSIVYFLKTRRVVQPGSRKSGGKSPGDSLCGLIVLKKKSTLRIKTIIRRAVPQSLGALTRTEPLSPGCLLYRKNRKVCHLRVLYLFFFFFYHAMTKTRVEVSVVSEGTQAQGAESAP